MFGVQGSGTVRNLARPTTDLNGPGRGVRGTLAGRHGTAYAGAMETTRLSSRIPVHRVCLIAALAAASCDRGPGPSSPGDETVYVDVMTTLSVIDARPPRTGTLDERDRAADSLRAEALRAGGLEPDDLIALAEQLGDDPARMQVLWEQITARVDSLVEAHDASAAARDSATESARFQTGDTDSIASEAQSRPGRFAPGEIPPDADSATRTKILRLQERARAGQAEEDSVP
jgi:hypothetical protein